MQTEHLYIKKKYTNVSELLSLPRIEGLITWFLMCSELERTKRYSCPRKTFLSLLFSPNLDLNSCDPCFKDHLSCFALAVLWQNVFSVIEGV